MITFDENEFKDKTRDELIEDIKHFIEQWNIAHDKYESMLQRYNNLNDELGSLQRKYDELEYDYKQIEGRY